MGTVLQINLSLLTSRRNMNVDTNIKLMINTVLHYRRLIKKQQHFKRSCKQLKQAENKDR